MSYQTNTRTYILHFLEENRNRMVSVSEIHQALFNQGKPVNITTIYRFLNKLSTEGRVLRYTDDASNQTVFQYISEEQHCEEHLHLKCTSCGKIEHLNCSFMKEISHHIESHHGFCLQCKNSVLYGLCKDCRAKKSNNLPS